MPISKLAGLAILATLAATKEPKPMPTICEVAKPRKLPDGAPRASDVLMRSLSLHPRNARDPHDTWKALEDFHVSRLEWAYINNGDFIAKVKASGRRFGGAASAPSYIPPAGDKDWFEKVVIVNADGKPIIAPWKRKWNRTLWGCINNPELEHGYLAYLKLYISAGAQHMQRDEPEANYLATRWGGCFCHLCMRGFREFLRKKTTAEERTKLGIGNLETFDYGSHLKKQGAPVGDAFGRWKGGRLKQLFVQFQAEATLAFHQRTRKAIDAYAGRRVPISCNNGCRRWGDIQMQFDWAFGELSYGHATAVQIHNIMREAERRGRLQVVTMPKKGDQENPEEWLQRTRRTIAMATASGGHCMVPWDTFMPNNAPRYFGTPEQYADLYGFIRASAALLDGYEYAGAFGKGMKHKLYNDEPPVRLKAHAEVHAVVRARPGQKDAPVVIHLIDWAREPKAFTVEINPSRFFGDRPLKLRLLTPPTYDAKAHQQAERSRDYSALSRNISLALDADRMVKIPALAPWAMLLVEPGQAP